MTSKLSHSDTHWLPVVTGAIGLALTASLIGFVAWEAIDGSAAQTPDVVVRAGSVHAANEGFVVQFEARNLAAKPAAGVVVEATLSVPGEEPLVSSVTLDYVPGASRKRGGFFLPVDPRQGRLELRALGYSDP